MRATAQLQAPLAGISESTSMRARTSSERLLSWVEVASMVCGQWRARCALARGSARREAELAGSPPTSFSDTQAVVDVERGVLDALGHHRRGELLELAREVAHLPRPSPASASAARR
jgi:hypothetical protein